MSEMIERVARAIEEKSCYVISQHHAKALARAAIEAMWDPTRKMVYAAMTTPYPTVTEAGGLIPQAEKAVTLEWQAMIKASTEEDAKL